ncbi:MAG TPA: gliding motility-associated ABC transporter permease subunit GldF [Bacteroidales bacterium]|nr:gliding motility-associated ABC transporter permease subunit GldF [Bacteroidales bacterium]
MSALFIKEINGFFSSLTGYIVMAVFLLINGLFLWVFPLQFNIPDFGYASLRNLFMLAPVVFLFLIPAITMKMFAEEKRSGTIEMLLTRPLTELQIILAKYFAAILLVIFSLLPTLIYAVSVYLLGSPRGNIDMGGMWGSYLGLIFLASGFVAIGIFCSSLTSNQIVSFVASISLCGFLYIGFEFIYSLELFGRFDLLIQSLGIHRHFQSMSRGVIDSRDVIYFLSLTALFILLTKISLESRKW